MNSNSNIFENNQRYLPYFNKSMRGSIVSNNTKKKESDGKLVKKRNTGKGYISIHFL